MNISVINKPEKVLEMKQTGDELLLFTGDFCPEGERIGSMIEQSDTVGVFGSMLSLIGGADIAVTNLESPLTTHTGRIRKAGPSLKGSPVSAKFLAEAGFGLVTLANNHILDYGQEGLLQTFNHLDEQHIRYVGAGESLEMAKQPAYLEKNGKVFAFINVAEHEFSIATSAHGGASPLDPIGNFFQIRAAREKADFVFLIVHGGHEMYSLPSPRMVELYRYYAELGVDAVIGHHAHVHSGFEMYNGVPIIYNLGNFVFDRDNEIPAFHTGIALALIVGKDKIRHSVLIPFHQFEVEPGIRFFKDDELPGFLNTLEELNRSINDPAELENNFREMAWKRRHYFLSSYHGMGKIRRAILRIPAISGMLFSRKRFGRKLNLVRCQSHRDILVEILEREFGTD